MRPTEVAEIGLPLRAAETVAGLNRAALARSIEFQPRRPISNRSRPPSTTTLMLARGAPTSAAGFRPHLRVRGHFACLPWLFFECMPGHPRPAFTSALGYSPGAGSQPPT